VAAEIEAEPPAAEWVEPVAEEPAADPQRPADPFDDVDTPAFLRRERRLFR
jgi:hypothetical protein